MEPIKEFLSEPRNKLIAGFLGVLIIMVGGYLLLSKPDNVAAKSSVQAVPSRGEKTKNLVSPAYAAAANAADQQRIDKAKETGSSAVPSLVNALPSQPTTMEPARPSTIATPNYGVRPMPQSAQSRPSSLPGVASVDPQRLEAMKAWMKSDMQRTVSDPVTTVVYTENSDASAGATSLQVQGGKSTSGLTAASSSTTSQETTVDKIPLPMAGTVVYAELIGRANSDSPGPVIARVLQGKYTGALMVGTFEKGTDTLAIKFSKMSVKSTSDGTNVNGSVTVDAVAVDTKYIGTGLATDVDHHYAAKISTAFVTSFMQGLSQAIQSSGSQTTSSYGTSIQSNPVLDTTEKALVATGAAAASVGNILQQEFGSRPTTVIVEAGTPIGILFL